MPFNSDLIRFFEITNNRIGDFVWLVLRRLLIAGVAAMYTVVSHPQYRPRFMSYRYYCTYCSTFVFDCWFV